MSEEPTTPKIPSESDIQSRLDAVRDKLKVDLEDVDERLNGILQGTETKPIPDEVHCEVHTKLNEIDAKLNAAKQTYENTKPQANSLSGGLDQKTSLGMGIGFSMAYTIIGAPLVGYGLGLLINKATGTQGWHIWTTLGFSVMAIAWVAMVGARNNDRL